MSTKKSFDENMFSWIGGLMFAGLCTSIFWNKDWRVFAGMALCLSFCGLWRRVIKSERHIKDLIEKHPELKD